METIGSNSLWSLMSHSEKAESTSCTMVRKDAGHRVRSYLELATKVADLQFRNRDHVLVFRGQAEDYRNATNNTTMKPSLFRSVLKGRLPSDKILKVRFDALLRCEEMLTNQYVGSRFVGFDRIKRHQILRWSILQHYEICKTPLLDVTQSLRIAASFASTSSAGGDVFLMVLGVPNISGAITASDEAGLQIVRLASACPPDAVRPHVQEGFLLGEYPGMVGLTQKQHYKQYEMDFGRRLLAKFRFRPSSFWKKNDAFPKVDKDALYPNENDPMFRVAQSIKSTSSAN